MSNRLQSLLYHRERHWALPGSLFPRVPNRLSDEINAENENQGTDNHNRCKYRSDQLHKSNSDREQNLRIYAIGPVPMTTKTAVMTASKNPAILLPPPTR